MQRFCFRAKKTKQKGPPFGFRANRIAREAAQVTDFIRNCHISNCNCKLSVRGEKSDEIIAAVSAQLFPQAATNSNQSAAAFARRLALTPSHQWVITKQQLSGGGVRTCAT